MKHTGFAFIEETSATLELTSLPTPRPSLECCCSL